MHLSISPEHELVEIDNILSIGAENSKTSLTRSRAVRFDTDATRVHVIEAVPRDMHLSCWVTKEELRMIRERDFIIYLLSTSREIDDYFTDHTFRGLENRFQGRSRRHRPATSAVLQAQRNQKENASFCATTVSLLYSRLSWQSRFDALRIGLHDAHEAWLYQRNTVEKLIR